MPDSQSPVTLGEIYRNLLALETRINAKFVDLKADVREADDRVNAQLDHLSFVPRGEYDERIKSIEGRLTAQERVLLWVMRAIAGLPFIAAGAAITAVLTGAL